MSELDISQILHSLAKRRPVFHSEADFQHELAWHLREIDPSLHPRLEYPFERSENKACDIILFRNGKMVMALELKYLYRFLEYKIAGEAFYLDNQHARNQRRYDALKDVERMERFLSNNPAAQAAVVVLTNDPRYWKGPRRQHTIDSAFVLHEGGIAQGTLDWAPQASTGTKKKREKPIELRGIYTMRWQEYCQVPGNYGKFRFLHIPVQDPERPSADSPD